MKEAKGSPNDEIIIEWFCEDPNSEKVKNENLGIGYIGGGNALLFCYFYKKGLLHFKKVIIK